METLDLYTKERMITKKSVVRGSQIPSGFYRLVVHIAIFNSKGQMLIQQRQPFKKGWSNMWDISVGGSAQSGDSSQVAAEREALEEIGYKVNLQNSRPALTINFHNGFNDIYLVKDDLDISKLKLQYEEVQAVKWASLDEILDMIDKGIFIPYHKSYIQIMFDMRDNPTVHSKETHS